MAVLAAVFAIFITCLPILIPVTIRNGSAAAIFAADNYKPNFKDLQFLIVVTAAVGLLELVEKIMESKLAAVSVYLQFTLFLCFLFSLFYALIQVGRYAEASDIELNQLNRGAVSLALVINAANIVAVIAFKWMTI